MLRTGPAVVCGRSRAVCGPGAACSPSAPDAGSAWIWAAGTLGGRPRPPAPHPPLHRKWWLGGLTSSTATSTATVRSKGECRLPPRLALALPPPLGLHASATPRERRPPTLTARARTSVAGAAGRLHEAGAVAEAHGARERAAPREAALQAEMRQLSSRLEQQSAGTRARRVRRCSRARRRPRRSSRARAAAARTAAAATESGTRARWRRRRRRLSTN